MEKEETIDLRDLFRIAMKYRKNVISIIAGFTAVAMILGFLILPKTYESAALVRTKAPGAAGLSSAAGAMAALGIGSASSPTMAYIELMKSRAVIDPIIAKIEVEKEEDRENITVKGFVKSRLEIKNTKGTDLIEITANAKSPEEAQMIATEVVNGFLSLMTQLNQNEQSLVIKFLNDRLNVSKNEMQEAERKLEAYRQEKKIFVPEEQAQAAIKKMAAYDTALSEMKVKVVTEQATLRDAVSQLQKQNVALKEFNIDDNEALRNLRTAIIGKEIKLIELNQLYTEKHPSIILLKNEIKEMNNKLRAEVARAVDSGTVTMNPIHAKLLMAKVQAEAGISVNNASIAKVEELQKKAEEEISNLSMESMEYMKLERDVTVAREVYAALVKGYENARIQEAMDSMDIQVVDAADLPKKPSGPRKLLITAIGGVLGVVVAFGYVLFLYSRKETL